MEHRFDLPYGEKQRLKIVFTQVEYSFLLFATGEKTRSDLEANLEGMLYLHLKIHDHVRGFKKDLIELAMSAVMSNKREG